MADECHPIWRQFAFRRFGAGDLAADLLKRFSPTRTEEFSRYAIYEFYQGSNGIPFTGLTVTARDGKLLSAGAWSCTWQFNFFSTEDPELERQYQIFAEERSARLERRRLDKLQTELQSFFSTHSRWPTNEQEFSVFVTGSRTVSTNDLSIILIEQDDGMMMEISSLELPQEKRSVSAPKPKN